MWVSPKAASSTGRWLFFIIWFFLLRGLFQFCEQLTHHSGYSSKITFSGLPWWVLSRHKYSYFTWRHLLISSFCLSTSWPSSLCEILLPISSFLIDFLSSSTIIWGSWRKKTCLFHCYNLSAWNTFLYFYLKNDCINEKEYNILRWKETQGYTCMLYTEAHTYLPTKHVLF